MKKLMIVIAMVSSLVSQVVVAADNCEQVLASWNALTQDARAEALTFELDLPVEGLQIVTLADYNKDFDLSQVTDKLQRAFVEKTIATFNDEVSTEEIEQSDFKTNGDPTVSEMFLMTLPDGRILGGKICLFQDGLDENGEEGDINWSACLRVNENAEVLRNESGTEYDSLYFEWSGH